MVEWESCFNCAILYISSSISKKSNRHLESIKLLPRFQRNKNQASNLVSSPLYQQLPWHTRDYPCGFINYPRDYKLPEGSAKNLYQAAAPGEGHGVTRWREKERDGPRSHQSRPGFQGVEKRCRAITPPTGCARLPTYSVNYPRIVHGVSRAKRARGPLLSLPACPLVRHARAQ